MRHGVKLYRRILVTVLTTDRQRSTSGTGRRPTFDANHDASNVPRERYT
jgi:hypothetical protein